MDVSYINHFISTTANVFDTMLSCELQRTSLSIKHGAEPTHPVSAVIGLSGKVSGSVVLSLSEELAMKAAGTMLFTEFDEITNEVVDAVGELANMVAGGAKAAMSEHQLCLGLPNVIVGHTHKIFFPGNVKPISVGFSSQWGSMSLDVGFNARLDGDVSQLQNQPVAASV